MSPAKYSFILTVIHNYLVCDTHEALEWKPDNAEKYFTNIKQRGAQAGWSEDGLDYFILKMEQEFEFRKEMKKKDYKIEECMGYFDYQKQENMI